MNTAQRQQELVDWLAHRGRASVAELATRFEVSDDTVRRDLAALAEAGVVQKVHGGAVALDVPAMGRRGRGRVLAGVKRALGRAAAALVEPGMTLMLDAGDSVLAVALSLPEVPLTVITPSLDVAQALADRPGVTLVLAGGLWNPRHRLFEGPLAEALISGCRADLAFLGACSVDAQGVTATEAGDAQVKRALVASSGRRVLVADHTKWAGVQPWFVAPLSSFEILFTDRFPGVLSGPQASDGPAGPEVRIPPLTELSGGSHG